MADKKSKIEEYKYKGELVQLQKMNDGNYRIMRLLSTNPTAYLSKEFQPGKVVKVKNLEKPGNVF